MYIYARTHTHTHTHTHIYIYIYEYCPPNTYIIESHLNHINLQLI